MVSIISERIRVANIINQFLSNKISIDEAILEMPDLEKTRDPSIDSVDHLLHHIKLEKKSKSSYVKKLKIDL